MQTKNRMNSLHAIVTAVVLCASSTVRAEEILKIWISSSAIETIEKVKGPFLKDKGIKIESAGDPKGIPATTYVKNVIDGQAEGATVAVPIDSIKNDLRRLKVSEAELATLTHRVISHTYLAFVAHKENGKNRLSSAEMKDVFTGVTKNWKEIGGKDLPIKLVLATNKGASIKAFEEDTLGGTKIKGTVIDTMTWDEVVEKTAAMPGAIGFVFEGQQNNTVVTVDTPPVGRPQTLVTKGQPSKNMQAFIDYMRKDAKKLGVK